MKRKEKNNLSFKADDVIRRIKTKYGKFAVNSAFKYLDALSHTRAFFPEELRKGIMKRLLIEFITASTTFDTPIELSRVFNISVQKLPYLNAKYARTKYKTMLFFLYNYKDPPEEIYNTYKKIQGITNSDLTHIKKIASEYKVSLVFLYPYQAFSLNSFRFARARLSTSRMLIKNLFSFGE